MEINLHQFYNKGYTVTQLSDELLTMLWRMMYLTDWVPDPGAPGEDVPSWIKLDNLEKIENFPFEHLAIKKYMFSAPIELKEFGQRLLTSGLFDPLLSELCGGKHYDYRWINNIEILSFLPRRNTADIPWHTDFNGAEDFFAIMYLNDLTTDWQPSMGGNIEFGYQDENGIVHPTTAESPDTGKLILVNCQNPYIKHRVNKNTGFTRYALNIKFRINKL